MSQFKEKTFWMRVFYYFVFVVQGIPSFLVVWRFVILKEFLLAPGNQTCRSMKIFTHEQASVKSVASHTPLPRQPAAPALPPTSRAGASQSFQDTQRVGSTANILKVKPQSLPKLREIKKSIKIMLANCLNFHFQSCCSMRIWPN